MSCPDNYDLWSMHDAEQERWLESRPICCCCKEHIQSENAILYEGDWYCNDSECEEEAWKKIKKYYTESVD